MLTRLAISPALAAGGDGAGVVIGSVLSGRPTLTGDRWARTARSAISATELAVLSPVPAKPSGWSGRATPMKRRPTVSAMAASRSESPTKRTSLDAIPMDVVQSSS